MTDVLVVGPGLVGSAFMDLAARTAGLSIGAVVRRDGPRFDQVFGEGRWDVVVDATPTSLTDGGPALEHARLALERGVPFVTAAKGPLVCGFRELRRLSASTGAGFRFSAAVGANLPTVDLIEFACAGSEVHAFAGVVNDTCNVVLLALERGASMEGALQEASRLGLTDGDGQQDVSGSDTAAKIVGIANSTWDLDLGLSDVELHGFDDTTAETARAAAKTGHRVRLVGRARRTSEGADVVVRPEPLAADEPLVGVGSSIKTFSVSTSTMGLITVAVEPTTAEAAGAALLRDVLLLTNRPYRDGPHEVV